MDSSLNIVKPGKCIVCKDVETKEGYSTCSTECAKSIAVPADFGKPKPDSDEVSTVELASIIGVSTQTIQNWEKAGKINCDRRTESGARIFKVSEVREAMKHFEFIPRRKKYQQHVAPTVEFVTEPDKVVEYSPDQVKVEIRMKTTGPSLDSIRAEMVKAAIDAARDVCLRKADYANKTGDQYLRAQCLDDFIQMEHGLKMTFTPRGSTG